jgi:hypothetical protein
MAFKSEQLRVIVRGQVPPAEDGKLTFTPLNDPESEGVDVLIDLSEALGKAATRINGTYTNEDGELSHVEAVIENTPEGSEITEGFANFTEREKSVQ